MVDFSCTNFNDKFFLITPSNAAAKDWIILNAPQFNQGEKMSTSQFSCRGSDGEAAAALLIAAGFDVTVQRVDPEQE